MPRRFPPNHKIEILKRIGNTMDFETLYTFYSRRRDMTVTRKDSDGVDTREAGTDYFVPARILTKLESQFSVLNEESFGEQIYGKLPYGGRTQFDDFDVIGGDIRSDYFIKDIQRKVVVAIIGIIEYDKGERRLRTIKVQ